MNHCSHITYGDRHKVTISSLQFGDQELHWKSEIKYLGIFILSTRRFCINCQYVKQKFFRSLNGIFGKVGLQTSPTVLCSLVDSYCTPVLLYALESLN